MEADDYAINKMRDFLSIYNKIAEICFSHCVENLNSRELTEKEVLCIEKCSTKSISVNHKVMMSYMECQPEIVNRRTEELEKQQKSLEANLTVKNN